ncbi:MAG TPA: hypothetical protein VFT13_09960, partial [Candidatus Krumholzibacteria bacterium]|nr:hypothetical protein [Candidatus Krumholzibacteria bacterium]
KMASIATTMSGMPDEFWLIVAHVQGRESVLIVQMLQREYVLIDQVLGNDALGLLVRRRAP